MSLFKIIQKEQPAIVHANTPKASLLSMVAAKVCGVPHRIYTVTGLRFETTTGPFRFLLKTMERITCSCATKVIPEGEGVKETLYREKITNKEMHVILNGNINGIDCHHYDVNAIAKTKSELRDELQIPKDCFLFIFVGRIVKDKGMNELVTALKKLKAEGHQCRLLLVGNFEQDLDPVLPEVEAFLRNDTMVHYVGYQKDVRPFFKMADALVFPSYREGFPNVVMQAGAMGLPSLVTNINGSNEIIIDGMNGEIIPKQDSTLLYEKMKEWVVNPNKVIAMATKARPLIVDRYEQSLVWNAILHEYQQLDNNHV